MSEHIVSVKVYLTIFLILIVGTILTVVASRADFPGPLNAIVAMTIAVFKATAVVLYFMHVRYSSRFILLIVGSALFWLVILFFVPFVNLPFLLLLCLLPSKPPRAQRVEAAPWPQVRPVDRMIPQSQVGSALVSIALRSCHHLIAEHGGFAGCGHRLSRRERPDGAVALGIY